MTKPKSVLACPTSSKTNSQYVVACPTSCHTTIQCIVACTTKRNTNSQYILACLTPSHINTQYIVAYPTSSHTIMHYIVACTTKRHTNTQYIVAYPPLSHINTQYIVACPTSSHTNTQYIVACPTPSHFSMTIIRSLLPWHTSSHFQHNKQQVPFSKTNLNFLNFQNSHISWCGRREHKRFFGLLSKLKHYLNTTPGCLKCTLDHTQLLEVLFKPYLPAWSILQATPTYLKLMLYYSMFSTWSPHIDLQMEFTL